MRKTLLLPTKFPHAPAAFKLFQSKVLIRQLLHFHCCRPVHFYVFHRLALFKKLCIAKVLVINLAPFRCKVLIIKLLNPFHAGFAVEFPFFIAK